MRQKILGVLWKVFVLGVAMMCGAVLGRMREPPVAVHAQNENVIGSSTCIAKVPASWGEYKGGSSYGLAFQDSQGTLRFVANPPCGGAVMDNTVQPATAYIALELQRR